MYKLAAPVQAGHLAVDETDQSKLLEALKAGRLETEAGDLVPAEDVLAGLDAMLG